MEMVGNVGEWQANCFNKNHETLALRGGSWRFNLISARSSARGDSHSSGGYNDGGFRVVSPPT
jgi:formylglycine-generating enzyme required for sulfatase activity